MPRCRPQSLAPIAVAFLTIACGPQALGPPEIDTTRMDDPSSEGQEASEPPDDIDGDGLPDEVDSCPFHPNSGADSDGDEVDDACDVDAPPPDSDTSNEPDPVALPGPEPESDPQSESPPDTDGDGIADENDSCPATVNLGVDEDADGIDDACDPEVPVFEIAEEGLLYDDSSNPPPIVSALSIEYSAVPHVKFCVSEVSGGWMFRLQAASPALQDPAMGHLPDQSNTAIDGCFDIDIDSATLANLDIKALRLVGSRYPVVGWQAFGQVDLYRSWITETTLSPRLSIFYQSQSRTMTQFNQLVSHAAGVVIVEYDLLAEVQYLAASFDNPPHLWHLEWAPTVHILGDSDARGRALGNASTACSGAPDARGMVTCRARYQGAFAFEDATAAANVLRGARLETPQRALVLRNSAGEYVSTPRATALTTTVYESLPIIATVESASIAGAQYEIRGWALDDALPEDLRFSVMLPTPFGILYPPIQNVTRFDRDDACLTHTTRVCSRPGFAITFAIDSVGEYRAAQLGIKGPGRDTGWVGSFTLPEPPPPINTAPSATLEGVVLEGDDYVLTGRASDVDQSSGLRFQVELLTAQSINQPQIIPQSCAASYSYYRFRLCIAKEQLGVYRQVRVRAVDSGGLVGTTDWYAVPEPPVAPNEPPMGWIDSAEIGPDEIIVTGWALDREQSSGLKLRLVTPQQKLDGQAQWVYRGDVCAAYPDYPCGLSGFRLVVGTPDLSAYRDQLVTVEITDRDGSSSQTNALPLP